MNILGISCFYHDAAASLVCDGKIVAAVQEERFTRVKNDENFPINSIQYCLSQANLLIDDIDGVPIIKNLTETINMSKAIFNCKDPFSKNTIIKAHPATI
jgi:predicted NodU family carbamoyl transferase